MPPKMAVVKKPSAPDRSTTSTPKTEASSPSSDTTTTAQSTAVDTPWGPVSQVIDKQGLSFALFGPAGAGKTTLGASATSSEHGRELLIVNFDNELRSLSDRSDIQAWPRDGKPKTWRQVESFLGQLSRRVIADKIPFKTFQFDTMNAMYELAYKEVIGRSSDRRDGRQIYGDANDMVLGIVREWASLARETGINVVFVAHSEEKQDGENGPIVLRMAVTPGVVRGMYQAVSTVGCLLELPGPKRTRKLLLHNTSKIVAKMHQPRTGAQLPLEIMNPDLGRMIEHVKGIRPYPTKEKDE